MTKRFLDFDQFMEEVKEEPVVVRMFGEDYELPASLPAGMMLQVQRANAEGKQLDESAVGDMIIGLFGEGTLEVWLDKGITWSQLQHLMQEVMKMHVEQIQAEQKAMEKKATPRKRK